MELKDIHKQLREIDQELKAKKELIHCLEDEEAELKAKRDTLLQKAMLRGIEDTFRIPVISGDVA